MILKSIPTNHSLQVLRYFFLPTFSNFPALFGFDSTGRCPTDWIFHAVHNPLTPTPPSSISSSHALPKQTINQPPLPRPSPPPLHTLYNPYHHHHHVTPNTLSFHEYIHYTPPTLLSRPSPLNHHNPSYPQKMKNKTNKKTTPSLL